jgi:putative endonuclease
MKGWMYILKCSDGSYYVGSTNNLELRIEQHQIGNGTKYTKKRLPIALVYSEEFEKIEDAYLREKQVQGWGRNKREALIKNQSSDLPIFSIAYRDRKKDTEII